MAAAALLSLVLCNLAGAGTSAADAKKPNLAPILAADLGWKDVGYNGGDYYETPHLDRTADEGMIFNHAYATAGTARRAARACSRAITPRDIMYMPSAAPIAGRSTPSA
ncbi:MAG: sulfatase-like hydrolase/transferase [Opitutaceae bacterium]